MKRALGVLALFLAVCVPAFGRPLIRSQADPLPPCVDGQYQPGDAGVKCQVRGNTTPTAYCEDGTIDYSRSIAACAGHGGVLYWLGVDHAAVPNLPQPQPAAAATGTASATATPSPTGPAGGGPGATNPVGVLTASIVLDTATCQGGLVGVTVTVTQGTDPVPNATVSLNVGYKTGAQSYSMPPTGPNGQSSAEINTGQPRGGYTLVWNVLVIAADGRQATAQTSCFVP